MAMNSNGSAKPLRETCAQGQILRYPIENLSEHATDEIRPRRQDALEVRLRVEQGVRRTRISA
jgi:hypothetical protein